jgi:hypothetical protein
MDYCLNFACAGHRREPDTSSVNDDAARPPLQCGKPQTIPLHRLAFARQTRFLPIRLVNPSGSQALIAAK